MIPFIFKGIQKYLNPTEQSKDQKTSTPTSAAIQNTKSYAKMCTRVQLKVFKLCK